MNIRGKFTTSLVLFTWLLVANSVAMSTTTLTGSVYIGNGATISTFTSTPGPETYALYLSSGLNISSGPIVFPDGSQQAIAQPSVASTTVIPQQNLPVAALGLAQCLSGSTVTVTLAADAFVGVFLTGSVQCSGCSAGVRINVLADGSFFYKNSTGPSLSPTYSKLNMDFFHVSATRFSQGTHSFCAAVIAAASGPSTINDASTKPLFGVFEIR